MSMDTQSTISFYRILHRAIRLPRWSLVLWGACVFVLFSQSTAWAQEQRIALLIGHQFGWKGDPTLKYALQGDLRPMARALRRVGFRINVLQNPSPDKVRRVFAHIKRRLAQRSETTFLFYYTGHADQTYFHLGRKRYNNLRLQEFVDFFRSLGVTRKFAIIDSCYSGQIIRKFGSIQRFQRLARAGSHKGVRAMSSVDLRKLMLPNQGTEEGVRIISSSLDLAWELKRYKASVFTHHLLHGLKGKADLNRDGKITVDELFDFASRRVIHDTGQRPQQWVLLKRGQPYALAPAYQSHLWIGPEVVGHLQVMVANFMWSQTKHTRRPWQLSVVNGVGHVFLKRRKRCFKQQVMLPKGQMTKLPTRWHPIACRKLDQLVSKGTISLPLRTYVRPKKPIEEALQWGFLAGYSHSTPGPFQASHLSLGLLLRAPWWGLSAHYQVAPPDQRDFQFHRIFLQGELGRTYNTRWGDSRWQWFVGGYIHAGTIIQMASSQQAAAPLLGAGLIADVAWWPNQDWGIRFGGVVGPQWTQVTTDSGFSLHWDLKLALVFRIP